MSKRTVYTDEPIEIGRRVSRTVLPGDDGTRTRSVRARVPKKPVTLRLSPKLVEAARRDAKRANQTMSEFVEARLRRG